MKRIPLLAALVLVVGLLAGCGSSDSSDASGSSDAGGPPTNASVEDFCGAFLDLIQQVQQAGADISDEQAVKLAKGLASKLADVGTPADMPADARRAFETAIDKINALPDDATQEEVDGAAGDLTEEQKADQASLSDYITQQCASQLAPSASPSS